MASERLSLACSVNPRACANRLAWQQPLQVEIASAACALIDNALSTYARLAQ